MAKIEFDKYYTPDTLAKYCVDKTKEIIGEENITEYLEPSAGNGSFLKYLPKDTLSYDLYPESNEIIKQDYLDLLLDYRKGRCIIGNPPFGKRNILSTKFYKKSIQLGDYISFILPIGQLNNTQTMYEFDLLFSEDLGIKEYSKENIHCCLNIYKRNESGYNKKSNYKLKDVDITEIRRSNGSKNIIDYDIRIMAWGGGKGRVRQLGCEVEYPSQFSKEFCIKVNNNKLKERVLEVIRNAKWEQLYPTATTPNILQWQVYKYIKEQIPEIK